MGRWQTAAWVLIPCLTLVWATGCKDEKRARPKSRSSSGPGVVESVENYNRYMAKSKTVEAVDALFRMQTTAVQFFERAPEVGGCRFPESTPLSPDVSRKGCCSKTLDKDGDGRCEPNSAAWSGPGWQTLKFEMTDPHYFGYRFESSGEGATAKFTATAHADMDCDGTLSTFQRFGYGEIDAQGDCTVVIVGNHHVTRELE